jgi:hypothetical protein
LLPAHETQRGADTGCPYKNRCPLAMPRCQVEMPAAYQVAGGGVANCFLYATDAAHESERAACKERAAS